MQALDVVAKFGVKLHIFDLYGNYSLAFLKSEINPIWTAFELLTEPLNISTMALADLIASVICCPKGMPTNWLRRLSSI